MKRRYPSNPKYLIFEIPLCVCHDLPLSASHPFSVFSSSDLGSSQIIRFSQPDAPDVLAAPPRLARPRRALASKGHESSYCWEGCKGATKPSTVESAHLCPRIRSDCDVSGLVNHGWRGDWWRYMDKYRNIRFWNAILGKQSVMVENSTTNVCPSPSAAPHVSEGSCTPSPGSWHDMMTISFDYFKS